MLQGNDSDVEYGDEEERDDDIADEEGRVSVATRQNFHTLIQYLYMKCRFV